MTSQLPDGPGDLRERPLGELLKQLSEETTRLVHQELELAKAELTQKGRQAGMAGRPHRRRGVRRDRGRAGLAGPDSGQEGGPAGARAGHRDRQGGRAMGQEPDDIRQEIEQTRAEMSETVDAIGYKADVPSRAKEKVSEKVDNVKATVS